MTTRGKPVHLPRAPLRYTMKKNMDEGEDNDEKEWEEGGT
jgi:hypothetical protein